MSSPVPVVEIEFTRPIKQLGEQFAGVRFVKALLRFHDTPVGWLQIPVSGVRLATEHLVEQMKSSTLNSSLDGRFPIA